ncbi:helix-turn-helix transcriptional regulator [Paraburkholderia oxyphila]|uniref:helix-turn-helix transcriptional regulator n=1 Tax=Paraburkholderia oxyphila TaxID=614212 RepID=UPI001428CBBB|nr:helix-turn-helix domain-containing protein [Paraburkholderia oxyphila]
MLAIETARGDVFSSKQTHGRALSPTNEVIASSDSLGWESIHAALLVERGIDAYEPPVPHPSLIYHVAHPTVVRRKLDGHNVENDLIRPGQLGLTPGGLGAEWKHDGKPQILQIYLKSKLFNELAEEILECDPARIEINPCAGIRDAFLEQLALAIMGTLHDPSKGARLYVDTLAHALAAHLARRYTNRGLPRSRPPSASMSNKAVARLGDFIEVNLEKDLSLSALAAAAGLSPVYLSKAFKAAFGDTPHQYILRRRIERAKEMLQATHLPIIEIALGVGFSSQSHLSTWFKHFVGVSPGAYRRSR